MSKDKEPATFQHLSTSLFGGLDNGKKSVQHDHFLCRLLFLTLVDCKRPLNALRAK